MHYIMAEIFSMLYSILVALFLLVPLWAAYQVFSESGEEYELAPATEPLDPEPTRPPRKSRKTKARTVDDDSSSSSNGNSCRNPNPKENDHASKMPTSRTYKSEYRISDDDDRKKRDSARRKSRKERSTSPATLSHRRSQPRPEAYLTPYIDLSYEVGRDLPPVKPVYRRSGASQRHNPPPDEETVDEPGVLTKNPKPEYMWFHTVRRSVLKHGRSDYRLDHGSTPLGIAYMLTLGWITLDECLEWAGGRAALGQGLLDLAELKERGIELRLSKKATLPSVEELETHIEGWMGLRCPRECRYKWKADAEERKRYGPFGPALGKLAPPGMLENALKQITEPAVDVESVMVTDYIIAVLKPLIVSVSGDQKGSEQNDDQESQEREAAEMAKMLEEALLDEQEAGPVTDRDETAPPSDTKTNELITITDGSICTPPDPDSACPHDSTSPTPPSTIASTPSVDYLVLPPWRPVDAGLFEFNKSGDSSDSGISSGDSDMEDCSHCTIPQPVTSGSLEPEFGMSPIPNVGYDEMDVEMTAVEADMADLRAMSIDSYIAPEPSIWYPTPQPAQMEVFAESTIMDAEMQETVQEVAPIPAPRTFRPIPRASSIEMQDVAPVPQGTPGPTPNFVSRAVKPLRQSASVEMQDVSQSPRPAQNIVPRYVVPMPPHRTFRPIPQSSSSMTGIEIQAVKPNVQETRIPPTSLQRNVPENVVSSPKRIVASPPPMPGPSTSQVVAQARSSAAPQPSGTASSIPKPPVVPRRQRANALSVPSAGDLAMAASIQRDRPRSTSSSAPVATQPVEDDLPDYDEEENELNNIPMSTQILVVHSEFEEAPTMPSSPTVAPPPANAPPLEYVTTELDAWERRAPLTDAEVQDVLASIKDVGFRDFLADNRPMPE